MVNGAFFVPSGDGVSPAYARATSVQPKAAAIIDQLTVNAGVFGDPRYYNYIIYSNIASSTQTSIFLLRFCPYSLLNYFSNIGFFCFHYLLKLTSTFFFNFR